MNCPECRSTHVAVDVPYQHKGRWETERKWITKQEQAAAEECRRLERPAVEERQAALTAIIREAVASGLSGAQAYELAQAAGYRQSRSTFYRSDWARAQRSR